jgi:hypothetical protein
MSYVDLQREILEIFAESSERRAYSATTALEEWSHHRRAMHREAQERYERSAKGRESKRRYVSRPDVRIREQERKRSDEYMARAALYRGSDAYRAKVRERYAAMRDTPEYREARRILAKRHRQTERYKETRRANEARRRTMPGYIERRAAYDAQRAKAKRESMSKT